MACPACPDALPVPIARRWLAAVGCWVWGLVLVATAAAQAPVYRHFDMEQGLPSSSVYSVFQDSQGYLWFTTEAGVSCYDGYRFTTYTMDDGLADNEIFSVFEDSRHRFWFQSFNGKVSYRYRGRFYNARNQPALRALEFDSYVSCIREDRQGNVWFGSHAHGLKRYSPDGRVQHYRSDSLPGLDIVYDLCEQPDGRLVALTGYGAVALPAAARQLRQDRALVVFPSSMYYDRRFHARPGGQICFGVQQSLYTLDLQTKQLRQQPAGFLAGTHVTNVGEWAGGQLWVATRNGVHLLPPGAGPHRPQHLLPGRVATSVLHDREGSLWITTLGHGVYCAPAPHVRNYTAGAGLPVAQTNRVALGPDGGVWLGHDQGWLTHVRGGRPTGHRIISRRLATRGRTNDIEPDAHGLWLANDVALAYFRPGQPLLYWPVTDNFRALAWRAPGRDTLFLGTSDAIKQLPRASYFQGARRTDSLRAFGIPKPHQRRLNQLNLLSPRVNRFFTDRQHCLWVATNQGVRAVGGRTRRGPAVLLPGSQVMGLAESPDGTLWIATRGQGLFAYRAGRLRRYTTRHGLASNICTAVAAAGPHRVWVGTTQGLTCLRRLPAGRVQCASYTVADGLAANDINDVLVHHDTVWAATDKGVSVFDARLVRPNATPPPVYVQGLQLAGRTLPPPAADGEYALAPNPTSLRVNFVGLSPRSTGRLLYRYRFAGQDTAWHYTQNTSIEFARLPPGAYALWVAARNKDGVWSARPATVRFRVAAALWQTPWFYVALVAVGLGGVYGLYHYRTRQRLTQQLAIQQAKLQEQERIRQQIAQDFHDEMGNKLASIVVFTSLIQLKFEAAPPDVRELLDNIEHTTKSLFHGTRDFIWAIDTHSDALDEVLVYLKDFAEDFLHQSGIQFHLHADALPARLTLPLGWSRHLVLIFKEALTNTVKHAHCQHVQLVVARSAAALELSLLDDGRGFDPAATRAGNGLANMQQRAAAMHGHLAVAARPEGGTALRLALPWPPS